MVGATKAMVVSMPIDINPEQAAPRRARWRRWLTLAVLAAPLTAWAFTKPVRLLAPEWHGLVCRDSVCVDDAAKLAQATALYEAALADVGAALGAVDGRPLMVFCSARDRYRAFGGGAERAITYPHLGSLIAPESWAPYFARRELIHVLRMQRLGAMRMLSAPAWFREGMAYSLSAPPPEDMPEAFVAWRTEYEGWAAGIAPTALWSAARNLQGAQ